MSGNRSSRADGRETTGAGAIRFSPEFLVSLDAIIRLLQGWREEVRLRMPFECPVPFVEDDPAGSREFLDFFLARLDGGVDWYSSRCAIAQSAPPSAEALAAQVVVGMLAPNLMRVDYAGAFGSLDGQLTELLSAMLRLPPTEGLSMYSGTAALHAALAAATREGHLGGKGIESFLVLAGVRAHSSIEKICLLCGLREDAVVRLDVGEGDRIDERLAALSDSRHVIALVGTAGDAETGSIDDFAMWGQMARRLRHGGHTARVVCDCVLTWPLLALSEDDLHRSAAQPLEVESLLSFLDSFAAMRMSDYWAIDFHKWARTPLGAAHLLMRRELLGHLSPTRLADPVRTLYESPHQLVVDTTRSAAGPAAAMLNLKLDGGARIRQSAVHGLLLARRCAKLANAAGWHAIPDEPHGPIVCLAPSGVADAKQKCLEAAISINNLGGPIGTVRWLPIEGEWALRLCFVHPDAPIDGPALVAAGLQSVKQ